MQQRLRTRQEPPPRKGRSPQPDQTARREPSRSLTFPFWAAAEPLLLRTEYYARCLRKTSAARASSRAANFFDRTCRSGPPPIRRQDRAPARGRHMRFMIIVKATKDSEAGRMPEEI